MVKHKTLQKSIQIYKLGLMLTAIVVLSPAYANTYNPKRFSCNEHNYFSLFNLIADFPSAQGELVFMPVIEALDNNYELHDLIFGMHSTLYINGGEVTGNSNETPKIVVCLDDSFELLYLENENFKEVISLHIYLSNDDYPELDLARLQSFDNLEYIVINFSFDACGNRSDSCMLPLVEKMIKTSDKSMTVLYRIAISE